MNHTFKSVLILSLFSCSLLLGSCSFIKKKNRKEPGMPRRIAVMPVSNRSQDFTAPVVIRYFLEKRLDRKGFDVDLKAKEVNDRLRQMGITNGNQINSSNVQNIGQLLKVDGIFQATLLEFRQELSGARKSVIRARFRLISTGNGLSLWEKEITIEKGGLKKVPVRGLMGRDWSEKLIRSIAKGPAGALPKKLVKEALKTLRR